MRKAATGLCLLLASCQTLAEPRAVEAYAYVTALQPPVWVLHKGERTALGASSPILMDDALITGPGARLHLALADGSLLKLGENTSLDIPQLQLRKNTKKDVLDARFKLLRGTLRYTAQKENASLTHELNLEIGNSITAQVSDTDLWGSAGTAEDRLILLEGKIAVASPGKPAAKLTQANSVYAVPRNQSAKTPTAITAQEAQRLLPQTELDGSHPALQSNGPHRIVLATYADETKARDRIKKYTQLGYPVELQSLSASGAYRVILEGLASPGDATAYASLLVQKLKLVNPQAEAPAQ